MRDLVERKAMQYALTGKERLGKGPLVLLVDKSSSMHGERDEWSTAVALALMGIASAERRTFAVVAFNGGILYDVIVKPGEKLSEDAIALPCSGGTRIDRAVDRGLEIIGKHPGRIQEADLVLITDGGSDPERAGQLKVRASQLGVTVLGVGIEVPRHDLDAWCDHVEAITDLGTVEDGAANALFGERT